MRWHLNVRNINPKSSGAAEDHGAMVAAVMAFLTQSQIAEETIQTSGMQLGENWTLAPGSRERDGYFASTDVSFTLADFTKYSSVWIGLSGLPAVTVRGVDVDHTDRIRFQNDARVKAVLAARDKAQGCVEVADAAVAEGPRAGYARRQAARGSVPDPEHALQKRKASRDA